MAVGGAAITRYQDAFIAALAIGLYLLLPGGPERGLLSRVRQLALCVLGVLPFVVIDLWYNWYRFESVTGTGHHEKLFGYPPLQGAAGLLISPGKGLLWYCPTVVLLALAGRRFC